MYIRPRPKEGIPGGLYRRTSEILRDMSIIENKISEVESKLSVRNLISTIIESDEPEKDLIDIGFGQIGAAHDIGIGKILRDQPLV